MAGNLKSNNVGSLTNKMLLLLLILLPAIIVAIPFLFLLALVYMFKPKKKRRKALVKEVFEVNNFSVNDWAVKNKA